MPNWLVILLHVAYAVGDFFFGWLVTVPHAKSLRDWEESIWQARMRKAVADDNMKQVTKLTAIGAYMSWTYSGVTITDVQKYDGPAADRAKP